jgi:hypothetical protein
MSIGCNYRPLESSAGGVRVHLRAMAEVLARCYRATHALPLHMPGAETAGTDVAKPGSRTAWLEPRTPCLQTPQHRVDATLPGRFRSLLRTFRMVDKFTVAIIREVVLERHAIESHPCSLQASWRCIECKNPVQNRQIPYARCRHCFHTPKRATSVGVPAPRSTAPRTSLVGGRMVELLAPSSSVAVAPNRTET